MKVTSSDCALTAPQNLDGHDEHDHPHRPNRSALSSLVHASSTFFTPVNVSATEYYRALQESQHPAECRRFLIIEDDLYQQGLGFSMNFYAAALSIAARDGRVLLEAPVNHSWPPSLSKQHTQQNSSHSPIPKKERARWCDRPPHTQQCFYDAWSHCQLPTELGTAPLPHHRRKDGEPKWPDLKRIPSNAPDVVRMKLEWIHRSSLGWGWHQGAPYAMGATVRAAVWQRVSGAGRALYHR